MYISNLGVDVGRSYAKFAYLDSSGKIHSQQLQSREINWNSEPHIITTLEKWCAQLGLTLSDGAVIVISAAGALEYERIFHNGGQIIEIIADVTAAAESCGIHAPGLVIIAGTGGACFVLNRGKKQIVKSYGPILGDLWGGLALGRMAARHLLDTWSMGKRISQYEQAMIDFLHKESRKEFLDWIPNTSQIYSQIAQLGSITVQYAELGHLVAENLCNEMIEEMIRCIIETKQHIPESGTLKIGLQGGMVENSEWLRELLEKQLRRANIDITLQVAKDTLEKVALDRAFSK